MPGPIDTVYPDGVAVSKATVRADDKSGHRRNIATVNDVRNADLTGQFAGIYVRELQREFDLFTGDPTPDNGTTCIRDIQDNCFKIGSVLSAADVSTVAHAAAGKTTPINADELPLIDSAASFALKKVTYGNLKATLYAETGVAFVTHAAASKTTPVDADEIPLIDSAASNGLKRLTWANLKATIASWLVAAGLIRDRLTADRTYYVRTDGNDSLNNGLANTSGGAFLTLQRAWNVIVGTLDLAGFTVTIQIADGTYTGGVDMTTTPLNGAVIFNGNSGATSNVIISTTNDDCFYLNAACQVSIRYMKLQTATSGNCLLARYPGAKMYLTNVNFGSCPAVHVSSQYGAVIECASNYTVSGGANVHMQAYLGGTLDFYSHTATMSGSPAWGTAFAQCSMTGKASLFSVAYSGGATGKRYVVDTNGVLQTYGAGTASTYFPGNVNGTTATGGVQG